MQQTSEPPEISAVLQQQGYALLPEVYSASDVTTFCAQAQTVFVPQVESVRHQQGAVYAVRNVLEIWPLARGIAQIPRLQKILRETLGPEYGLVRGLYFNKPPEQTWSLPWHKDLMIAIREPGNPGAGYSPPRMKLGVPHTEPPLSVLDAMLTVRIHLDEMTIENGPLQVLPGSHRTGKTLQMQPFAPVELHCRAGDVLLMRPLLVHASGKSLPGTTQQRRILHLEFATSRTLPGGATWWEFYPQTEGSKSAADADLPDCC